MLHRHWAFSLFGPGLRCFVGRLFSPALLLAFACATRCHGIDQSPAEKFVLEKLQSGEAADLEQFSPQGKAEVLGHEFVEDLLAGRYNNANIIRDGIRISNAEINNTVFVGSEVLTRVRFASCTFDGGIDFSGSQFDKDLVFENVTFKTYSSSDDDNSNQVQLIGTTVKGTLEFISAGSGATEFDIPVDFTRLQAGVLIVNANFDFNQSADSNPDLDLTEAYVSSDFSLSVVKDRPRYVQSQFLKVDGSMTLGSAPLSPQSPAGGFLPTAGFDLSHSRFQALTIFNFQQWCQPGSDKTCVSGGSGRVGLDGFSFQYLYIDQAGEQSAAKMAQFVDSPGCLYSASPYLMLEQYLRSNGYPELADEVFIRMRIRQRREAIWKHRRLSWLADWLLYVFTGYGRRPIYSLPAVLLLVVFGWFIFRNRDRMQATGDKNDPGPYSPFWYSVDLLLPIIELGVASNWRPEPGWWFGRTYAPIQRIAGWILLPLILAALAGVIQ
jgi:hypothetical protein